MSEIHDDQRGQLLRITPEVFCDREMSPRRRTNPWHHYITAVIELWLFIAAWAAICGAVYAITHL